MTTEIIIVLCSLFLLAYIFDISARVTKIPSVIFLLLLGWIVRQASESFHIHVPELDPLLPIFGTIGLILIVLEGSLELELNRSKYPVIGLSLISALIPMLVLATMIALMFHFATGVTFKIALINAVPFCVISSAIAIPGVKSLLAKDKEFVIYESSFSDILGVMIFNFVALNAVVNLQSFAYFGVELLLIIVISLVAVLALSFLLSRISHHITFTPIILLVILIYTVSKEFHLPSLLFILVFGLFLGNIDEIKRFKWIEFGMVL